MSSNIVITMARQYGSGGKTIGAMLAKELGINCYSREILRMASEESGINERLFGMSDEKMKGPAGSRSSVVHTTENFFRRKIKTSFQKKISLTIRQRLSKIWLRKNPV